MSLPVDQREIPARRILQCEVRPPPGPLPAPSARRSPPARRGRLDGCSLQRVRARPTLSPPQRAGGSRCRRTGRSRACRTHRGHACSQVSLSNSDSNLCCPRNAFPSSCTCQNSLESSPTRRDHYLSMHIPDIGEAAGDAPEPGHGVLGARRRPGVGMKVEQRRICVRRSHPVNDRIVQKLATLRSLLTFPKRAVE